MQSQSKNSTKCFGHYKAYVEKRVAGTASSILYEIDGENAKSKALISWETVFAGLRRNIPGKLTGAHSRVKGSGNTTVYLNTSMHLPIVSLMQRFHPFVLSIAHCSKRQMTFFFLVQGQGLSKMNARIRRESVASITQFY